MLEIEAIRVFWGIKPELTTLLHRDDHGLMEGDRQLFPPRQTLPHPYVDSGMPLVAVGKGPPSIGQIHIGGESRSERGEDDTSHRSHDHEQPGDEDKEEPVETGIDRRQSRLQIADLTLQVAGIRPENGLHLSQV